MNRLALLPAATLVLGASLFAIACKVPARSEVPVSPPPETPTVAGTPTAPPTPIVLENPTVNPSGVKFVDVVVGTGPTPGPDQFVTVHYRGTLAKTGEEFDSSYSRGETSTFRMTQVIKGFSEGLSTMKVGGKRIVYIPAELAYGAQARGKIPANADLVFEIELFATSDTQPTATPAKK